MTTKQSSPATFSTPSPQTSLLSPASHLAHQAFSPIAASTAANAANSIPPVSAASASTNAASGGGSTNGGALSLRKNPPDAALLLTPAAIAAATEAANAERGYFDNLVAVKNGVVSEVSLRAFDLLEEGNTAMTENDTPLSLAMFGAVKGKRHPRIF